MCINRALAPSGLAESSGHVSYCGELAASLSEHQALIGHCISRIVRWRTPPRWTQTDWVEEIRATALAAAWHAICAFDPSRAVPLEAFLRLHIIQECYARYRKEWNFALTTSSESHEEAWLIGDGVNLLDEVMSLADAVCKLPRCDQSLVRDLYWNGLSETDVARRLGISQQAINKRKRRILETLRCHLADKGPKTRPSET